MDHAVLIADSGSTKTDWLLVRGGSLIRSTSAKGLNPYFQSCEEIRNEMERLLTSEMMKDMTVDAVYFYGAGCVFDRADVVRSALSSCLSCAEIHVYSDLLAAAHSTCGRRAGIACIMGTGSNSCFYDGHAIVKNIPPLGFILGDEGSGAMLGRMLASDVLKGIISAPLRDAFFERFRMTQADILDQVYQKPCPNRFLASLSPFLHDHSEEPEIRRIVSDAFRSFLTRNVMRYDCENYPVNFVGSIAARYEAILRETASALGLPRVGEIAESPAGGLIRYYNVR
jgi:N-acetylglucosamine kinase-like BadF-type ATPase